MTNALILMILFQLIFINMYEHMLTNVYECFTILLINTYESFNY